MINIRFERSDNPVYLCAQKGPHLINDAARKETVLRVHASELDAELAAALTTEATRTFTEQHGYADEVTCVLLPPTEIPDGKLAHIDLTNGELVIMLPNKYISASLAARLAALSNGIRTICYLRQSHRTQ
jgi:hypothetical protein